MRKFGFVLALLLGVASIARAQDATPAPSPAPKKSDAPTPAPSPPAPSPAPKRSDEPAPTPTPAPKKSDEPTPKPDARKAPRPPEPDGAPIGEVLPNGTVARANLYPLDEGRRWTYELKVWIQSVTPPEEKGKEEPQLSEGPRLQRLDVHVAEPQKTEEGKDARVLDTLIDGELVQRQFFVDEGGEVACVRRVQGIGDHAKDNRFVPPQRVVPKELAAPPAKWDGKWEWDGKVGPTAGKTSYELLREEKITVKAGSFQCLVVKATVSAEDGSRGAHVLWLAPGVGPVREVTEVRTPEAVWWSQGELVKSEGPKKGK